MELENRTHINFENIYASLYDFFYREKDYSAECDFLEEIFHHYCGDNVKQILDIGCGTGGHAIPLSRRGYSVYGVDRSAEMTEVARRKASILNSSYKMHFETASIQNLHIDLTFDAAICMFSVLSYQTSNEDLFLALQTVRSHLKSEGLFICDFWYGPAVLKQRPTDRIKIIHEGNDRVIRIAKPLLDIQRNIVTVLYHVMVLNDLHLVKETQEAHRMRYFFKPEIEFFMHESGLDVLAFCPFGKLNGKVTEETWNACVIAKAI